MNLMRRTTVDANGTVSFVTDGKAPLAEGCITDANSMELLLDSAAPILGNLREQVFDSLANNDERSADGPSCLPKRRRLVP